MRRGIRILKIFQRKLDIAHERRKLFYRVLLCESIPCLSFPFIFNSHNFDESLPVTEKLTSLKAAELLFSAFGTKTFFLAIISVRGTNCRRLARL